jgi:lysophospholipase L1-like esterase
VWYSSCAVKALCPILVLLLAGCGMTPTEKLRSPLLNQQAAGKADSCVPCAKRDGEEYFSTKVIFMGDSTTHGWINSPWFQEHHFIEYGVGGSNTDNMLARFPSEVIAAKPDVVVILGGANDPHFFDYNEWHSEANLQAMYEMAAAAHIKVIACTIMPVRTSGYSWANPSINRKNDWIRAYGQTHPEVTVLDYWNIMLDPTTGELRADVAIDNVHLWPSGYALLTPVTDEALRAYSIY